MVRRMFTTIAALAAALLTAVSAQADIGYAQAAEVAQALRPDLPLYGLRLRTQAGRNFYASSQVDAFGTLFQTAKIDASTGVVFNQGTEPVLPPLHIEVGAVMARLGALTLGFGTAVAAATANTGQPESQIRRVDLSSVYFMIVYDIRYQDGTRVLVDGATGAIVDGDGAPTAGNSVDPAQFVQSIALARGCVAPNWVLFDLSVQHTATGLATSALFLNPANTRVKQVDLLAGQASVVQFTPIGHLGQSVAALRPRVPTVVVSAEQFVARIAVDFPGALVSGIKLSSRALGAGFRTRWSAMLLTTQGPLLEYSIDATVPVTQGLAFAQMAAPAIPGDLNGDGRVLGDDLGELVQMFGQFYPPFDLDQDGAVGGGDLAILLQHWG